MSKKEQILEWHQAKCCLYLFLTNLYPAKIHDLRNSHW